MTAVSCPSCAFLGHDAGALARRALRRTATAGAHAVLVRWGCSPGRPSAAPLSPSARAAARRLATRVPADWLAGVDGRLITVDVPVHADADEVLGFVRDHDGPVAIAVGGPRTDGIDAVLRTVDEVVVVEPAVGPLRALLEEELAPIARRLSMVPAPRSALSRWAAGDRGQSTVVALLLLTLLIGVASAFGLVASALGRASDVQGRADVASLLAAQAMLDAQPLLYSPDPNTAITDAELRARAVRAARASAAANELRVRSVDFVGDDGHRLPSDVLPTRVRITVVAAGSEGEDRVVRSTSEVAVAALTPTTGGGDYSGALAIRQGQRMRPDVALAFDRMNAAATQAGHPLVITSAYRSDAEQAELFRRNPDPKWVARPGTSLHRLGTELDLGPNAAWSWLAANCGRFGFLKRYPWEAWHFGFIRNAGSASVGFREGGSGSSAGHERSGTAIPSFVPARFAPMIARSAQRWSVGAALLGAQLKAESGFDPNARSPVGAAGIAQFMPATGLQYGLTPAERFDPAKAIDAQAHLMHDLLRQLGSVPLALAAYNAGPGAVSKCMCVPPYPETQGYVQKILALLGGAGVAAPAGLQIRLVA